VAGDFQQIFVAYASHCTKIGILVVPVVYELHHKIASDGKIAIILYIAEQMDADATNECENNFE
jgi:hypothetical protein